MSDNPYAPAGGNPYGANPYGSASAQPSQPAAPSQPADAGATLQGFGFDDPAPGGALIKDTTTANFTADVIQESRQQPVLVDFWAPWCGPCKQLTPILERVVNAARGRVKLVKMNIDDHPSIAGQMGVQSIPAVFAFVGGQPVDGFMGALPESEVKAFVDRLTEKHKGAGGRTDPVDEALAQAGERLAAGDTAGASQLFGAVLQHEPDNAAALSGLAECYIANGQPDEARAMVEEFVASTPQKADDPAIAALQTKFRLSDEIGDLGDAATLEQRLQADADDHQARFDLALIAQARGDRAAAASHLLEIIRRDRTFDDDGARRKLVEFFEAWGPTDPATKDARRQLSSLLFA